MTSSPENRGAGETIRDFLLRSEGPLIQAVFVTSHSPSLVRPLLSLDPHYIYLGDEAGPATPEAWLEAQLNPTPLSCEALQERGHTRFDQIQAVLGS